MTIINRPFLLEKQVYWYDGIQKSVYGKEMKYRIAYSSPIMEGCSDFHSTASLAKWLREEHINVEEIGNLQSDLKI